MKKVLIMDTSILCVWLEVPGMATCGPDDDKWDKPRVTEKIDAEIMARSTLVSLPEKSMIRIFLKTCFPFFICPESVARTCGPWKTVKKN